MQNPNPFTCSCCGTIYEEIPLCFGSDYPEYYYNIPAEEVAQRVELTESLCVIDNYFFHRGRITIPINDYEDDLLFNVWVTISEENFEVRNSMWENPERINLNPYFGWLQADVPTYGDTINLKTIAIENEVGLIPAIEVIEDGHPLRYDQQNGISLQVALEKLQYILASQHKTNPD